MARKRDNSRHLKSKDLVDYEVFRVVKSDGDMAATCTYACGSRATDKYAFTCLTIELACGKSYELTIRPRGVELKENKHGN